MTTATMNGKRVTLSIEEKARLLRVFELEGEPNVLAVTSGSDPNKAYAVKHNGEHVTHCPCDARIAHCSHAIAAQMHLEAKRREAEETCQAHLRMFYSGY